MRTIRIPPATIQVVPDSKVLARAAADAVNRAARAAIAARGRFLIALSGGSTPRAIFQLLAAEQEARTSPIDWSRVHVFFGDERCVPSDHPDSNYRMAREALLSKVPIPEDQIHRVQTELGPELAAERYAAEVISAAEPEPGTVPSFDLILLGMGTDGHTASLFPETTALEERQSWVVANWVVKLGAHRVTFTYPLINAAKEVLFIAAGEEKALVLRHVLRGDPSGQRYPSQHVRPQNGVLTWLVDESAAQLL
jgi:6-phosphogluconolactonase